MDNQAAANVGKKFGESVENFTTASSNTIEAIVIDHCNEGIRLMSKQIKSKARTGQASTLASSMLVIPKQINATSFECKTTSNANYWAYVDKGVKGVKNKSKASQSPFSFKNLGTPKDMVDSFKKYIARTGSKSMRGKKLILRNKKKQASIIEQEAKQMAVATKIGGIKPMNFVEKANNSTRNKELGHKLLLGLGKTISLNIKISVDNGN